jgi:hypothetical protein
VRVRAIITDTDSGQAVDPVTLTAVAYAPSGGANLNPTPTRDSLGQWEVVFTPTTGGNWVLVLTGTEPTFVAQRKIPVNPVPLS